jgi:hypothetical protein
MVAITKRSSHTRKPTRVQQSATSPHFGHKPAYSRIPLNSEPRIVVKIFAKFVKMRVCPKWGLVTDGCTQSTESPILFRSCGHETPFSDQKWASKIGDSVLWLHESRVAIIFCNHHLAKLLQKNMAFQKNQHIASHVAIIFCNHLANLLQKIVASQKNQHIVHAGTKPRFLTKNGHQKSGIPCSGCTSHVLLLSFVIIILQNCYKRAWHSRKTNTSHHMLLLSFVIILQTCYKR